ncbi:hypothetical protein PARPLA_01143 [Rhodobacteraceae bacterium THAF1]|uniref:hypothetical protein n=1 Tax=Palleronia sp. THAF1 TaxID=2587842 RepID=UPI000F3CD9EA|nr:hypothetical protein [Palleronia sp. THAF1]QFU07334.1 hypothetical protein FIU81_01465 [Palleronia sp. THAF1]VDC20754.1 hypothetical protein PARPLA_01143 [Rhodobacteraceae bacterium THAF1]
MLRYVIPMLVLIPLPAAAQDALAQAAQTYRGLTGEWAEPSKNCADPADTWSFGMQSVRAGNQRLELLGVGTGAQGITIDLVSQSTGQRVPLALIPTSSGVAVRGSGISADLQRCLAVAQEPTSPFPAPEDNITAQSLDPDVPSSDELRDALAANRPAPSAPAAEADDQPEDDLSADEAFRTAYSGSYSSGGACDWRIDDGRITANGSGYDVMNVSGDASRLGVQAMGDDGTPITFTLTPDGSGARVQGSGDAPSATLRPC